MRAALKVGTILGYDVGRFADPRGGIVTDFSSPAQSRGAIATGALA